MKYRVLAGAGALVMEEIVKDYIRDGWRPQGGIAVDHRGTLLQAMVKYEEEDMWKPILPMIGTEDEVDR